MNSPAATSSGRFHPLTTDRQAVQWLAVTVVGGALATGIVGAVNVDLEPVIKPGERVDLRPAYQGASTSGDLVNISVLPRTEEHKDPGGRESPIFAGIGMQYDRTDPSRSLLVAYISDSDPAASLTSAEVTIGHQSFPMTPVQVSDGELLRFQIDCKRVSRSTDLPVSIAAWRDDGSSITASGTVDSRKARSAERSCTPDGSLA